MKISNPKDAKSIPPAGISFNITTTGRFMAHNWSGTRWLAVGFVFVRIFHWAEYIGTFEFESRDQGVTADINQFNSVSHRMILVLTSLEDFSNNQHFFRAHNLLFIYFFNNQHLFRAHDLLFIFSDSWYWIINCSCLCCNCLSSASVSCHKKKIQVSQHSSLTYEPPTTNLTKLK